MRPLVVAKNAITDFTKCPKLAAPGRMTTANLLLDLHGGFCGSADKCFSDIMPALENDEADLGVIIHEGRFTYYQNMGLRKILDLGEWWEDKYHFSHFRWAQL